VKRAWQRYVDAVIHRPLVALLIALAATAFMAAGLPRVYIDSDARQFLPDEDIARDNLAYIEEIFGDVNLHMIAVLRSDHPDGAFNPETLALVSRITAWLQEQPEFETAVNSDLRSLSTVNNVRGTEEGMEVEPFMELAPDDPEGARRLRQAIRDNGMFEGTLAALDDKGTLIMVRESEQGHADQAGSYLKLKAYVDGLSEAGHPEQFFLAGRPVIEGIFYIAIPAEGRRLMPFVLAVISLLVLLSFRTLRSVGVCLAVIAATEIWTFGFLGWWGHPMYTISSILLVVLVPIAVADSIHLLSRYYDAQVESPDAGRDEIVRVTMMDMGPPVLLTSVTTAVGFLSTSMSSMAPLRDFGVLAAVGVTAAFVLTLLLIPALLVLLPLKAPRFGTRRSLFDDKSSSVRLFAGAARAASRRRNWVMLTFAALVVGGIFGASRLTVDSSRIAQFPPGHEIRDADDAVNAHFSGSSILDVVIDGGSVDAIKDPALLAAMLEMQRRMDELPQVGGSLSLAELVARMNRVMHGDDPHKAEIPGSRALVAPYLLLYSMSGDPGDFDDMVDYDYRHARMQVFVNRTGTAWAKATLERARAFAEELFNGPGLPSAKIIFSGDSMMSSRMEVHVINDQVRALAICLPLLTLICWAVFGRLALGVLAVMPVTFALLAAYGGMGFVGVPVDIPIVMLGGMTLGIGLDFAIHYLYRYLGERRAGVAHEQAAVITAVTAGRALFFNAVVLVAGFLVLLAADLYPQIKLGALTTITVAVCYLVSILLFPATLSRLVRIPGSAETRQLSKGSR